MGRKELFVRHPIQKLRGQGCLNGEEASQNQERGSSMDIWSELYCSKAP